MKNKLALLACLGLVAGVASAYAPKYKKGDHPEVLTHNLAEAGKQLKEDMDLNAFKNSAAYKKYKQNFGKYPRFNDNVCNILVVRSGMKKDDLEAEEFFSCKVTVPMKIQDLTKKIETVKKKLEEKPESSKTDKIKKDLKDAEKQLGEINTDTEDGKPVDVKKVEKVDEKVEEIKDEVTKITAPPALLKKDEPKKEEPVEQKAVTPVPKKEEPKKKVPVEKPTVTTVTAEVIAQFLDVDNVPENPSEEQKKIAMNVWDALKAKHSLQTTGILQAGIASNINDINEWYGLKKEELK
jgi:hypothetical protein